MVELVARVQWRLAERLIAEFAKPRPVLPDLAQVQSAQIAITALLRSVGHVFAKVDCAEADRRAWMASRWPAWRQDPIFTEFIEPSRNALLKEFKGLLDGRGEGFGPPAFVVDPSAPDGMRQLADFDPTRARDARGHLLLPQMRQALAFWDRCLREAEASPAFSGPV